MSEYKYHSPFKRVFINDAGGQKIKTLQNDFDKFWKQVNRVADKCPEKFHAMKAMQEACMWLTRAAALQNQKIDGIQGGEVIIDDPLNKPSEHALDAKPYLQPYQKTLGETLAKYKEGDTIQIKNTPHIIFKKKR